MTPSFVDPVNASLREVRMVLERLVQWKGVEPGMIPSVLDCGLYSAALGLSTFQSLREQLELLSAGTRGPAGLSELGTELAVDGGGSHAWLLAEPVLDVLVEAHMTRGVDHLVVSNITQPDEMRVITGIAEKHSLHAKVSVEETGIHVAVSPRNPARHTLLDHVRRKGIRVSRTLWFELLKLSSNALAEDTVVSRTHTGVFMIKPDGTVVGEQEPEFQMEDRGIFVTEKLEFRR